MHRTQLQRFSTRAENKGRAFDASRDQLGADQGGDKVKKSVIPGSLHEYWLAENMRSMDGLMGLVTALDAALRVTPQSEFDQATPRPKLRRRDTQVVKAARDRKLLASGFVLGVVSVFAISKLAGSLKG